MNEELDALKEEVESVNKELAELTPEELEKVTGGFGPVVLSQPVIEPVVVEVGGPALSE